MLKTSRLKLNLSIIRLRFVLVVIINMLSFFSTMGQPKSRNDKPNIILIYVDDLGYGDLGSYGAEFLTPNIDKIGKEGIRFTDFYAANPVCTPSRFGLLTGMAPYRSLHGLTNALMPNDKGYLDKEERVLSQYLQGVGYQTALIGKWHLGINPNGDMPDKYGFNLFTGSLGGCIDYFQHEYGQMGLDWYINSVKTAESGYSTDLLTNHAIDFIQKEQKDEQPFFLYLAYNAPHYGKTSRGTGDNFTLKIGDAKYNDINDINTLQVPEEYLKKVSYIQDPYRRTYAAMVQNLDDNIGRLLSYLEEHGLEENTMIWFISDNGGYAQSNYGHGSNGILRGQKAQLYEGGIRVPAMVKWPKEIQAELEIKNPVINMDVLPTLAKLLGFEHLLNGRRLDGVDISRLWEGKSIGERALYWKFGKQSAIRKGKWKLINNELYDLEKDPQEKNDLSDKKKKQAVKLEKLRRKIAQAH